MQLKTVGESLNAINTIDNILKPISDFENVSEKLNKKIIKELCNGLQGYSTEATKAAIAQSTLNEEQIRGILESKGYQGKLLETTTEELAMATATNKITVAEIEATATTHGLGYAVKGLGDRIKALASAHPVLLAITTIIASTYAISKLHDKRVKTINEVSKAFENQKSKLESYRSELEEVNSKLKENKTKLEELNKLKENGEITTEQLQELAVLKDQTAEYRAQYELILSKTEAQEVATQKAAAALVKLREETEKLQNDKTFKFFDTLLNIKSYFSGTSGIQYLTSWGGKSNNKISNFFGKLTDLSTGKTMYEMATGISFDDVNSYKELNEYLKQYKDTQKELNSFFISCI